MVTGRVCSCAMLLLLALPLRSQVGPPLSPELRAKLSPVAPVPMPAHIPALPAAQQAKMDRDLMEIDIRGLQKLYISRRYRVEDVVRWYLTRIARYNGIYRAFQTVDVDGAVAAAKKEDTERHSNHGPLWGVPVAIKANTAVAGLLNTDGWQGFARPGHEFIAPKDATVVRRLRAAGAIIVGITNMPDFAASDTTRSTAFGRTGNAYDVRFSPGGSSGGTVTAVTANMVVFGTGTDTANSIRMPAGTSALVGLLPTRGLVSIAGIAPLDWLRDNTGPIARNVTDAALTLDVLAGEDPLDFRTANAMQKTQALPYEQYLKKDALKGKRFGIPAFIFTSPDTVLHPETRAMLAQTVAKFKAAGAEVIVDPDLLPGSFLDRNRKIVSRPYLKDGADQWLKEFGPTEYRSGADFTKATGIAWPPVFTGERRPRGTPSAVPDPKQTVLATDPDANARFWEPQKASLAEYDAALDKFHLDGLIYPSAQMPPVDETMAQDGTITDGPHSETGWVNRLGVPAIVLPAGFYSSGLPFGLEISGRAWHDGDLLGWAYAFEQSTKLRKPPALVESGLLPQK